MTLNHRLAARAGCIQRTGTLQMLQSLRHVLHMLLAAVLAQDNLLLSPTLCRFADNALEAIKDIQASLHKANEPCSLYAVHGHYADAGEIAALVAHTLGVPMVLTGHSLGRNKLDSLKRQGKLTGEEIEVGFFLLVLLLFFFSAFGCFMLLADRFGCQLGCSQLDLQEHARGKLTGESQGVCNDIYILINM